MSRTVLEVNKRFDNIKKAINDKLEKTESEEDKKKLSEHLENIESNIKNHDVLIYYGEKVDIEETNESYISLADYIITEGKKITNSKIKDSLDSIINYLENKLRRSPKSVFYTLIQQDKNKKKNGAETNDSNDENGNRAEDTSRKLKKLLTTGDTTDIIPSSANVKLKGDALLNSVFVPFAKILFAAGIFGKESVNGDTSKDNIEIATLLKEITSLYQTVLKDNDSEGNNTDFKKEISEPQKKAYFNIVKHLKKFKPIIKAIDNKDIKVENIEEPENADKLDNKAKELINNTDTDNNDQKKILTTIVDPDNKDLVPGKTHGKEGGTENDDEPIDSTDDNDEEKSEGVVPVLVWSPVFLIGCDLAKATKEGPRKEVYTMKNMFDNYQYFEMEGGLSKEGIEKFLGEQLIANGISITYNIAASKPCIEKNGKYEVNTEDIDANEEREDFGTFTNAEITEIINDNTKGKNYLKGSSSGKISKSDKKKIEATQSKVKEIIKDNDKLKDYCKNSETLKDVVNDDGSINDEELDNVSMAVTHEQSKENKGFWGRVKGFFKSLFGGGDDNEKTKKYDDNEIKELLKQIKELLEEQKNKNSDSSNDSETSKNESLIDINNTIFENKTFRISLKDYIMNTEN